MKTFRNKTTAAEVWKSHVLAQMKQPRCWICEESISGLKRDFFWFASEQYYEPRVVDNLRLAHGFCPTHTRHFLQTGAKSVITAVFSYLAWYMIEQLNSARDTLAQKNSKADARQRCSQAAEILRSHAPCPMCSTLRNGEQVNLTSLNQTFALGEVRDVYKKSPGICLPHFSELGCRSDWETLRWLTADMHRRLSAKVLSDESNAVVEQTAGLDSEVVLRRRDLQQGTSGIAARNAHREPCLDIGAVQAPASPTMEQLIASLQVPGCSVCNACEWGVQNYLDWLAQQMEAESPVGGSWESCYNICPGHLWRLYSAGYERAAIRISRHMMHDWLNQMNRLMIGLSFKPLRMRWQRLGQGLLVWCGAREVELGADFDRSMSRRSKAAAVVQSPEARLEYLRVAAFPEIDCEACRHIRTITTKRLDLILRALEDPVGRKAYHQGSGLCLRHCVAAARLAVVPHALDELLSAQVARLRMLEWELEEALRKSSWSVRYEPKGPETDAWRRAAYQFCGV